MKLHRVLLLSVLIGVSSTAAWADPPSNMQVFTSSGSFTVPSGVTKIEVEVRGGGGGAGGGGIATTFAISGQGGCGGGYGKQVFTVTAGTVLAVTVGVGGAGGASGASGVNGTAGGASSFGTLISATGGGGGLRHNIANPNCAGGTSTGALNMTGQIGEQNGPKGQSGNPGNNRGGACGDGSSRGSGGRGIANAAGSVGVAGNVVVRW